VTAACPHCGSRILNYSRFRSWQEIFQLLRGRRPLRCRDCNKRFLGPVIHIHDFLFARCPSCYRTDLNYWRKDHYRARGWIAFRLKFGARRYRCEYCRVNFASNRPRKEAFSFERWTHRDSV
jgi:DNA-directed RNA polymerase subunit RPC12/RpoP